MASHVRRTLTGSAGVSSGGPTPGVHLALALVGLGLAADADARPGVRCQTPELLRARNAGEALSVRRPDALGFVDSAIYPIRVHYRQAADADRAATLVMQAAETSWQIEVEEMGWPPPPPDDGDGGDDRYDYYLTNDGTFGGAYTFGFGPDATPGDGWYSVPSYIALDDRWITDADMLVFVSHEFNHALQYTIDAAEYVIFPWESTAEAMSDLVDDAADIYDYEVWDFNALPFASILFDGYTDEVTDYDNFSYYEYGGMIFGDFVEERYGSKDGTKLLAMWDAMAQTTFTQEPDFLDGLAAIDPSAPTAAALYTEFATWRMFSGPQDDGAHFEEAAAWGTKAIVRVEADLAAADLDGASLSPVVEPYELGTSYWRFDVATAPTDDVLHAEVSGDPAFQWGLVWAVWPATGGPALTGSALGAPGATVAIDAPLDGGGMGMIGVVNGGRPDLEGEERDVLRGAFTLDLTRLAASPTGPTGPTGPTTPPGTTDPGTDPTDPGPGDGAGDATDAGDEAGDGCGCAEGGRAGGSLGFAAALGVGALVRRRRDVR